MEITKQLTVNKTEQLAKASKELMLTEPFYGMFLIMLNKQWSTKVPTASVGRIGINYNLLINEAFWQNISAKQHIGLLKHELLHIAFFHLTDFEHLSDKMIANVAMDLEINQLIKDEVLPPGGMKLDLFPELDLEPKKGTFYYYEKLLKGKKKGNCPNLNKMVAADALGKLVVEIGDGEVNMPDHSSWGDFQDLPEATQKLIKAQTEYILKEVAEQTRKSRGLIPGELAGILEALDKTEPPKFDWKGYMRRFTGGSQKIYTKKTKRKFNKRYEDNPGMKIKPKRHVLVAVDTSGSVNNGELQEFFHEIHHMHKSGSEVTVVQCDAAISDITPYKRNMEIKVHGRGGTSFQPVIDYYNENQNKYTCLVYFTDGECSAPEGARGKILWVLSSTSSENKDLPGQIIKLN